MGFLESNYVITIIAFLITVLAGLFFVWLGRFLRDRAVHSIDQIPETTVQAEVLHKYFVESTASDRPLSGGVAFRCNDGKEISFTVDLATYETIREGEKGELVFRGNIFLSFGKPGVGPVGMELLEVEAMDYSFTEFDDDIDHEIPHGYSRQDLAYLEGRVALAQNEVAWHELYRKNKRLPTMVFQMKGQTDNLDRYPKLQLLSRSTAPTFLKSDKGLQAHFEKVYAQALEKLREREGESKRGSHSDGLIVERNLYFLQIIMQEHPRPYRHQIGARLYVNPKRKRHRKPIRYEDTE